MSSYSVVDLFCGAGGFSKGFEMAGFRVLAGIDIDENALNTFQKNHKKTKSFQYDLSKPNIKDLEDFFEMNSIKNVDVLIGGPPCQGFSIAGKRLIDDPRNSLWKAYIKLIERLNPKIVFLENVPTIVSLNGGKVSEKIIDSFRDLGYRAAVRVLNAAEYGVPQNRRRAIFVATQNELNKFEYPFSDSNKTLSVKDAISDLPSLSNTLGDEVQHYTKIPKNDFQALMRRHSKLIHNHISVCHTDATKRIIAQVPDGCNYKSLPKELQDTRKVNIAWTRMNSSKPCFTIDAGHNHHFHYKENRVPTVRECARIQSFPDNFIFYGTRTSQYRQVGNAVPPLLAMHLALKAKEILDGL